MSLFSDMEFPTASTPWANGNLVTGLTNYSAVESIDPHPVSTPMTRASKRQIHHSAIVAGTNVYSGGVEIPNPPSSWLQEVDSSIPFMMGMNAPSSVERRALDVLADVADVDQNAASNARRVRYNEQSSRMSSPTHSGNVGAMEPPTRTPGSLLFPPSGSKGANGSSTAFMTRGSSITQSVPQSPMDLSGILQSSMVSDENDTVFSGLLSNKKRKRRGQEVGPFILFLRSN